nr:B spike protein [Fijivirus sp.]
MHKGSTADSLKKVKNSEIDEENENKKFEQDKKTETKEEDNNDKNKDENKPSPDDTLVKKETHILPEPSPINETEKIGKNGLGSIKSDDNVMVADKVAAIATIQNEKLLKEIAHDRAMALIEPTNDPTNFIKFIQPASVLLDDNVQLPYYEIINASDTNFKPPTFFNLKSYYNTKFDYDQTPITPSLMSASTSQMEFFDASAEIFKPGTYKVTIEWDNTFISNLPDPNELGHETLFANVHFESTSQNEVLKSTWVYRMFKCFLAGVSSSHKLYTDIKEMTVLVPEMNLVAQELNKSKVSSNANPHPTFAATRSTYLPLVDIITRDLYATIPIAARPKFSIEVQEIEKRLKFVSKICTCLDQYTAALLRNDYEKMIKYKITVDQHLELYAVCSHPNYIHKSIALDAYYITMMHYPSFEQRHSSIFYIMYNTHVKTRFAQVFKDVFSSRQLINESKKDMYFVKLLQETVSSQNNIMSQFIKDFNSAIVSGNPNLLFNLLAAEFYSTDLYKFEFTNPIRSNAPLNLVALLECMVFFILFPKISWNSVVTLGTHMAQVLSSVYPQEYNIWKNEVGLFLKLQADGSYVRYNCDLGKYNEEMLYDEQIYFSFLCDIRLRDNVKKRCPFMSRIYELISPLGETISLDRKREAGMPYFRKDYRFYVSWSVVPQYTLDNNTPLSARIVEIVNFIRRMSQVAVQMNLNLSKQIVTAINEMLDLYASYAIPLGINFHIVIAKMFSNMAQTPLSLNDTFNPIRPFYVLQPIGFGATQVAGASSIQTSCIMTSKNLVSMSLRFVNYIVLGVTTVYTDDIVGHGCEPAIVDKPFNTVPVFDGDTIRALILDVFNESRRFDEMLYIISQIHQQGTDRNFRVLRETLRGVYRTSTARKLIQIIGDYYNYDLNKMFEVKIQSQNFFADPRMYKLCMYFVDNRGRIAQNQYDDRFLTRVYLPNVDEYFYDKLTIFSNLFFKETSPLYKIAVGITFGYFFTNKWDVEVTSGDFVGDYDVYVLGQNANYRYIQQQDDNSGYEVTYVITDDDGEDHIFEDPVQILQPHLLNINDANMLKNQAFVNFLQRALDSGKIFIRFPNLVYRYTILDHINRVDPPMVPNIFTLTVPDCYKGAMHFNFYDTSSARSFHTLSITKNNLIFRYMNDKQLVDDTVMTDIYGPNAQQNNFINQGRDLDAKYFGYGDNDGSLYPISNLNKLTGSYVNLNNHFYYISDKYKIIEPQVDTVPVAEI